MCFTQILCDKKYYVRQFVITVITSISIVIKEFTLKFGAPRNKFCSNGSLDPKRLGTPWLIRNNASKIIVGSHKYLYYTRFHFL